MTALLVVEGASDQVALAALAARRGVDLAAAEVEIVSLGGAHGIQRFVDALGPRRDDLRLAGLCDASEAGLFRAALEGSRVFVCNADLEDELIRSLGIERAEVIVEAAGDLVRFRKLQQMPAWRGRPADAQLRRFIAAGARRKGRYARLLVDALDLDRVPSPLGDALDHVT